MLREARERERAVGAFNVYNLEGALAVVAAAEELGCPVIIQVHPASLDFGGVSLLRLCQDVASQARVPIAVALDHAADEAAIWAVLNAACVNSVMVDGSDLTLDANTTWTAEMVRAAHVQGVSVEAELGKLAGEEDGLSVPELEARMTDPEVVAPFVAATGIDALAVTIGNVHGKYAKPPQLDFPRLDRIREATALPLVLHGASGLPVEMLQRAMRSGVCKFNVNTQVRAAAREAARDAAMRGDDVLATMKATTTAMKVVIVEQLRQFGW